MVRTFRPHKPDTAPQLSFDPPTDRPVAVYFRQSTEAQIGNVSTTMQTVDMVASLQRQGWQEKDIILIDADAGVSGTLRIDEREGMRQLYDLIKSNGIGAVACVDVDRLFRDVSMIQANIFIVACEQAQVQVITPTQTYIFHHAQLGRMFKKQFRDKCEAAADYLTDHIIGKLARARQRLNREGKWAGGRVPAGYMVDKREKVNGLSNPNYRKFVEFPEYAKVVREIFRIYVETGGKHYLTAQILQERGLAYPSLEECPPPPGFVVNYPTNGRIASHYAISQMMTNPAYVGHWMYHGAVIIENNHTPLIEPELFWQAFDLASEYSLTGEKNENYRGRKEKQHTKHKGEAIKRNVPRPLCAGLIYAFYEGKWRRAGVHFKHSTAKAHYDRYEYLIEANPHTREARKWARHAGYIDDAIVYVLKEKLLASVDDSFEEDFKAARRKRNEGREADKQRVKAQIADLDRAMETVAANLERATEDDVFQLLEARYVKMKAERQRLTAALSELETRDDDSPESISFISEVMEWKGQVAQLERLPPDALRRIISLFISRIEIPETELNGGTTMVIHWFDELGGTLTDTITLPRKTNDKHAWTFAELDTLYTLVRNNATAPAIAYRLPRHTWDAIRRQIRMQFGKVSIRKAGALKRNERYEDYLDRKLAAQEAITAHMSIEELVDYARRLAVQATGYNGYDGTMSGSEDDDTEYSMGFEPNP